MLHGSKFGNDFGHEANSRFAVSTRFYCGSQSLCSFAYHNFTRVVVDAFKCVHERQRCLLRLIRTLAYTSYDRTFAPNHSMQYIW